MKAFILYTVLTLSSATVTANTYDCSAIDHALARAYDQLRVTKDATWKQEALRIAGLKADCVLGEFDPIRGFYVNQQGVPLQNPPSTRGDSPKHP